MKHVIIGGDGFVGRHLAQDLHAEGQEIIVADVEKSALPHYGQIPFTFCDVTDRESLAQLPIAPDDMVYNLSARMLSPILPKHQRRDFFWPVNYDGTENILEVMRQRDCAQLVHFTTDMVYGHSHTVPQYEDHEKNPLGPYGDSKLQTEILCEAYRGEGMRISIFRPRLIIGRGRLGILSKLFKLIDHHLPVPMIGGGHNPYQFVSVYDCASACQLAWRAQCPNSEYNLGSDDPPSVRELLGALIKAAGSHSILVPTPAGMVKAVLNFLDYCNLPLMDPEQYLIADEVCILDTGKAKSELGWTPRYSDSDMLIAAYEEYREDMGDPKFKKAMAS